MKTPLAPLLLSAALAAPLFAQDAPPPPPVSAEDLAAEEAAAPASPPPAGQSDSGIVTGARQDRVPLEMFMVPKGCEDLAPDEICITGDPYEEEEDTPPPLPGDRRLDVQAERKALSSAGSDRTPIECGAPIGPATTACAFDQLGDYKEEKELLDEQYFPPEPE